MQINRKFISLIILCVLLIANSFLQVFALLPENKFAVLIGAGWNGEPAPHNDVIALQKALRIRGYSPKEILSLDGNLNRSMLISFLLQVKKRVSKWKKGTVFFYFSGHGTYRKISNEVEPGLWLNTNFSENEQKLYWSEIFSILNLPPQIKLILLPDN